MAKPQNTAYQVQGDFTALNTDDNVIAISHTGPVGLDPLCVADGKLKLGRRNGMLQERLLAFVAPEKAYISFGYSNAEALLKQCRSTAKQQFKKGERPTFFLRKMTMSEFMAHKEFKKYRSSNPTVQKIFKKYLLLDNLRDSGFQG